MLKEFDIKDLTANPFKLIGDEWMLISAGNDKDCNTMTASWGGLGVLWNKNVAYTYIRPTRHTYNFVEKHEYFTLSFFGKDKAVHDICGSKSGRDIDKIKACNLTPIYDYNSVYFAQAEIVLVCKKIYIERIKPENFLDDNINKFYPLKDYHNIYVGEIVKALKKEGR